MNLGKRSIVLALSLLAAAPAALARGSSQEADGPRGEPLRYARVSEPGARIVNLPDANGIVLARPAEGAVLAVWRELSGWLEVEAAGGFEAWVHGRYLAPVDGRAAAEGPRLHEVTRNAINIRPLPNSEVTSFPLPQRLHSGDRVLVLALDDPSAPLAETWARIVTPPGVHAWIHASEVATIAGAESGAELWRRAQAEAAASGPRAEERAAPAPDGLPRAPEAEPAEARTADEADRAELEELRAAIDAESEAEAPDYGPLADRLAALSERAGGGLRLEVEGERARLEALREVAEVRAELERERRRREEELWRRERGLREASRAKDPLGGVFRARGVLLRSVAAGQPNRYTLRFGGRDVCDVTCSSARYDLDLFSGYEIGVFGDELQGSGAVPTIDARRVEIIKGR